MPNNNVVPVTSAYEYIGDIPALGSLQLTKLAQSYEQLESQGLEDLFPTQVNNERTIVVETVREGLGIMPIVEFGKPAGNFMEPERIERRYFQPAVVREDDFIDQGLINQLRMPGTMNEAWAPMQLVERRVQKLVSRHNRTVQYLQAQVLQGGINYTDPRTNVSINVSTQIPVHNFFRYDGWDTAVTSGAALGTSGYNAGKTLTANKGRKEALLFTSKDGTGGSGTAAVSWAHPRADIIRCLRLIKQYLMNTNKNLFTELVMSRDLYTVIQENEIILALMGGVGVVAGGSAVSGNATPPTIQFGPGGDITQIAGLKIRLIDTLFRNPVTNNIEKHWPSNLVALVAAKHMNNSSTTLGYTQKCVGEAPDGTPGLWMRTGPDQMPPAVPGRAMQMGDAFLPFAMYPQWISLLTVAETAEIESNLILRSDISYGTF